MFCVKVQKRVNADFHKTQYFLFFKNLCKFKNLSFCENVEIKTFEDCFVLCKNAKNALMQIFTKLNIFYFLRISVKLIIYLHMPDT